MHSETAHWIVACACGVLSFATALFYRALRSASPARLEEINRKRRAYASLPDLDDALVAVGWCKVAVYSAFAASVAFLLFGRHGGGLRAYMGSSALAAAVLLAQEALVLVMAGYHSGQVFYRFVPLVSAMSTAGGTVLSIGGFLAGIIARISGWEPPLGRKEATEEQIRDAVIEGKREGVLPTQESRMIESIIEFKDVEVAEIMTPRTEIVGVPAGATAAQALEVAIASGHTRLPVRAETADDITGVLYIKDLLRLAGSQQALATPVKELMRRPYFVPETKRVRELLQEFRATNVHIAIVLDEYGGTSGIVTIEDILEEIVGDIEDEFQAQPPQAIRSTGAGKAVVQGQAMIADVNEALGCSLTESDEYDTVAGFLLYQLRRIPETGEAFVYEGVHFRILDAEARRIKRVMVEVVRDEQAPAAERA